MFLKFKKVLKCTLANNWHMISFFFIFIFCLFSFFIFVLFFQFVFVFSCCSFSCLNLSYSFFFSFNFVFFYWNQTKTTWMRADIAPKIMVTVEDWSNDAKNSYISLVLRDRPWRKYCISSKNVAPGLPRFYVTST